MPWYQPCVSRGYSKFYDQGSGVPNTPTDPDRDDRWIVTDQYLFALEAAFRQGFFDAGGQNVEDTGSRVFDLLAENCVTTTQEAYNVGRASAPIANAADPGGTVDISGPGSVAGAPIPSTPNPQGDLSVVYGSTAPSGQPAPPAATLGSGSIALVASPYSSMSNSGSGRSLFSGGGGVGGSLSFGSGGGSGGGINWLLIAAIAAGAWFLTRK